MPDAPCYKFTVASADEAAALIRERLGPAARVLSVRTVEPSGLRRLWAAPRLEVIAQVEQAETGAAEPPVAPEEPSRPGPRFPAPEPRSLPDLLRRSGLSELALGRIQSSSFWPELRSAPLHRGLAETGRYLLREAAQRPAPAPLARAAFLGTPGVGRTTALCKWLGTEVFRRARLGHVVTVEFDRPNSPGPLPVFCEALGVPLAHYPAATLPAMPGGFVYFDLPGISTADPAANASIAEFLERENVTERVLVLNAAYDHAALRSAYAAGRALGATHLVFTHLDEVPQWGRLWDYLFDATLVPLFLGTGPSLTGDCEDDIWSALVARTLAGCAPSPEQEDETEAAAASSRP